MQEQIYVKCGGFDAYAEIVGVVGDVRVGAEYLDFALPVIQPLP
jgi:hypothetical protein